MKDISEDSYNGDEPRKRAVIGDGISTGSASTFRESESPPPRRSKTRSTSDPDLQRKSMFDQRPHVPGKKLFDTSHMVSINVQRLRMQALQSKSRKNFQSPPQISGSRQHITSTPSSPIILESKSAIQFQNYPREETFNIII